MGSFDNFIVVLPNAAAAAANPMSLKKKKKIKTRICHWERKEIWPDKNNSHHNHVCQHIPRKTTHS